MSRPIPGCRAKRTIGRRLADYLRGGLWLIWGLAGASAANAGGARGAGPPTYAEEPLWSIASPVGAIEYHAGRGVLFGSSGLNIGGFSSFEAARDEDGSTAVSLEGINFLIVYEPRHWLHAFAEIEAGPILEVDTDEGGVRSRPTVEVERLYVDLDRTDRLNIRLGKFRTPIGRWNLVPAEPFTWTANEPLFLNRAFADRQSGGMVFGSVYPAGRTLSYWVYAQAGDPFDNDSDPPAADHDVGGRIEYGGALGKWSVGASVLATEGDGDRTVLGGLDGEWHIGRLELTTELTGTDSDSADRELWDGYVQGVWETIDSLYLVGRYEHLDPPESTRAIDVGDAGIAWVPRRWLRLKATYRFADHETDDVNRGLTASLSVVF
jgi:hypothetical protein